MVWKMNSLVTTYFVKVVHSLWLSIATALGVGALVAVAKGAVMMLLLMEWKVGVTHTVVIDLCVTAIAVSAVVAILFGFVRAKRMMFLEQIEKVTELNHHVRNDLQVIVYQAAVSQDSADAVRRIMDAVAHIDETLRSLFPMVVHKEVNEADMKQAKTVFLKKQVQPERRQDIRRDRGPAEPGPGKQLDRSG